MSMLRGPLRYGPSGNERTGCSNSWCSRGIVLGSQEEGLGGNCYKSSARVSNKRKERHVRCAKQEKCREDTL